MRTRKSARKLCGKCRGEVNKRGRKGDERAESRMKEMESEEAKRIENETSDRFRDWFQLWVMIAAEVCVYWKMAYKSSTEGKLHPSPSRL